MGIAGGLEDLGRGGALQKAGQRRQRVSVRMPIARRGEQKGDAGLKIPEILHDLAGALEARLELGFGRESLAGLEGSEKLSNLLERCAGSDVASHGHHHVVRHVKIPVKSLRRGVLEQRKTLEAPIKGEAIRLPWKRGAHLLEEQNLRWVVVNFPELAGDDRPHLLNGGVRER